MRDMLAAEARRFWNTCVWSLDGWRAAWASEKTLRQWTLVNVLSAALAFSLDLTAGERALLLALGLLVLLAIDTARVLFVASTVYLLSGPLAWVWGRLRRERRPPAAAG